MARATSGGAGGRRRKPAFPPGLGFLNPGPPPMQAQPVTAVRGGKRRPPTHTSAATARAALGPILGPILMPPPAGPMPARFNDPGYQALIAHTAPPPRIPPRRALAAAKPPARVAPPVRVVRRPAPPVAPAAQAAVDAHKTAKAAQPPRRALQAVRNRPAASTSGGAASTTSTAGVGVMTDQQILDSLLGPQRLANDQATSREAEYQRQKTAVLQGFTQALMNELKGTPGQVADIYKTMEDRTMGMANQAAAGLAAANPNAQTQALLQSVNAPAEQQAQLATQNQATYQGGAALLQGTQGFLPGETLARVGAAQQAFAAGLPAVTAAQGHQALQQYLYEADQRHQQLLDQRAQVEAGAPKLLMDIRNQRAAQQIQQQNLGLKQQQIGFEQDLAARQFGLKAQNQRFTQGATVTRLNQSGQSLKLRSAAEQRAAEKTFSDMYGVDSKGNLTLPGRRALAAEAKASKPASKGGFTASQKQKLAASAQKMADLYYYGKAPTNAAGTNGIQAITDYQQALRQMLAANIPLSMAEKALNAYWKPGVYKDSPDQPDPYRGRPNVSYQARAALAKAGMPMEHPSDYPSPQQIAWLNHHGLA